jgi:hypothetical protein
MSSKIEALMAERESQQGHRVEGSGRVGGFDSVSLHLVAASYGVHDVYSWIRAVIVVF